MTSIDAKSAALSREQVLQLSNDEKLLYFAQKIIVQHPRMDSALNDILLLSTPRSGTDIILLIGPTGVGKSATIQTARKQLINRFRAELQEDAGFIPIVTVEAPASGVKSFSWRILYKRIGQELNEPMLDSKVRTVISNEKWTYITGTRGSMVGALRESIEKALKHRRTRLLVIDEAVHALKGFSEDALNSHMDALKSISNLSGVTLCLTGSYDLFSLLSLSGQVARRTAIVHLPRYLTGIPEDERMFRQVLLTLQNRMPLEKLPNLRRWSLALQKACAGCVGTLKDTLLRALTMALERGGVWDDRYLAKALLSEAAISTILEETLKGEAQVQKAIYGARSFDDLLAEVS